MREVRRLVLVAAVLLVAAGPAAAGIVLPPGFTAQVYVTGIGFEGGREVAGIPSVSTMVVDETGLLYLARTGRRYFAGDAEDLSPVYRIPLGGARVTPDTERQYVYGPPLPNPQVVGARPRGELLVTTFDRDRKVGVLYRMIDGHAELLAGGTPERGQPRLLTQPEGAASDRRGHVFVAERERGVIVKLDAGGRVLDPRYVAVVRPRLLAVDQQERLWIGADGTAAAPWQPGRGEIWKVSPEGEATLVLRGPVPAGMALSPSGRLIVADRHGGRLLVLTPEGRLVEFARFTDGDAPRAITFAPATAATLAYGLAGDLFVVVIRHGAWPLNEIVRINGPFDGGLPDRAAGPQGR